MDKKHTLVATLMSDFDKLVNTPAEPPAPKLTPTNTVRLFIRAHLTPLRRTCSPGCRTQTATINTSYIPRLAPRFFGTRRENAPLSHSARHVCCLASLTTQRWADTHAAWSPKGSYLATFHVKGIALWGGPSFSRYPSGVTRLTSSAQTASPIPASASSISPRRSGTLSRGLRSPTRTESPSSCGI